MEGVICEFITIKFFSQYEIEVYPNTKVTKLFHGHPIRIMYIFVIRVENF
jgi:hypothetical protein